MRTGVIGLGLSAAILGLAMGAAPASAEMFTCHDKPGQVLAVYNGSPGQLGSRTNYSSYRSSRYAGSNYNYNNDRSRRAQLSYSSRRYGDDRSRW